MTELSIFERMQALPLFQGLSISHLQSILRSVKLNFRQHDPGEVIAEDGSRCDKLIFVLSGMVSATYKHPQGHFSIEEELEAPMAIDPIRLYGVRPFHDRGYRFMSDGSTFVIDKPTFVRMAADYEIFMTNFNNMACSQAQMANQSNHFLLPRTASVEQRMIHLILPFIKTRKGRKSLVVKIQDLAEMTHTARINLSKELNRLHQEGSVVLRRQRILFPDFESFIHTHA